MWKLGIEEWLIRTVQAMYINEKSSARVNGECSPWLDVQVAVHQACLTSIFHRHGSTIMPFPDWFSLRTPLWG